LIALVPSRRAEAAIPLEGRDYLFKTATWRCSSSHLIRPEMAAKIFLITLFHRFFEFWRLTFSGMMPNVG